MTQFDLEEDQITQDYNEGRISLKEYNRQMLELQRDYRDAARESAERAYEDELELAIKSIRKTWADDEEFDPHGKSGGNFDYCYERGTIDGETNLARYLLPRLRLLRNELENK